MGKLEATEIPLQFEVQVVRVTGVPSETPAKTKDVVQRFVHSLCNVLYIPFFTTYNLLIV